MEKNNFLHIEFGQNLKNFIPEIIARGLILLSLIFGLNSVGKDHAQQLFFVVLFLVFNVVIFLLTIYGTGRRKVSILNFIEMRLKVDEKYGNTQLEYSSNFNHTPFYFYVAFSAIVFFLSLLYVFIDGNKSGYIELKNEDTYWFILPSLIFTFMYGLTLRYYRMNFISKKIVAVTHNGIKLSEKEVEDFMSFLYDEKQEAEGYYVNDGLIYELERNANIYKQRVETLLIEAVFIGALTFGTFIQLTSPESIGSFREIDDIEMKANGLDLDSLTVQKHEADFNMLLGFIKKYEQPSTSNESRIARYQSNRHNIPPRGQVKKKDLKSIRLTELRSYLSAIFSEKNKVSDQRQGIFQDWALQRHYNIFSFFYKDNVYDTIPDLFLIDSLQDNFKVSLETDIYGLKQKLKDERNNVLKLNRSINDKVIAEANIKVMSSEVGQRIIRKLDQLELLKIIDLHGNDIYDLRKNQRAKVLRILNKHDKQKFTKYYCITKDRWDEQEYLFLIAIGSIICSVLYISVLINRFVIILKIETLFSEINKAMAWNRREEDALANEVRTSIEGNNQVVLNEFIKKRKYYTEKLQIQLAKCSQIGTKIETNIQVATFVRSIGLYTFFTVLLIGTMMLDPKFTFVLSFILIYAMVGSAFMQEGSNVRQVWQQFSKNSEVE
jgi:hypothetical protein